MSTTDRFRLQDVGPFAGHAPQQERPLGGYAVLAGTFAGAAAGFTAWLRASDRELPEHVAPGDLALVAVATHKASRLVSKDRVTSVVRAPFTRFQDDAGPGEVDEAARGRGMRRAVGELLVCPYCVGMWIAGRVHGRPDRRATGHPLDRRRTGRPVRVRRLQIAYAKAEEAL